MTPKLTIEVDDVIAMRLQAMLDARSMFLDPTLTSSWEFITDSGSVTGDTEVLDRCLHLAGFYQKMEVYPDFEAEKLEEELDGGTIKAICVCSRPNLLLKDSELPEQSDADYQTLMWLIHKAGLRSLLGVITNVEDKVADLRYLKTDLHIESDPTDFQRCEDAGIPVLLWDRPWNRHISTTKRIGSIDDVLEYLGVTRDRTALACLETVY